MEEMNSSFKFNEGVFQMERIHEIQSKINFCKNFSLLKDKGTNLYGFETWFNLLNSLFFEFIAKLNDKEIDEVTEKRLEIKNKIKNVIKKVGTISGKRKDIIDNNVWYHIEECLFSYELALKKLMVKHKISSPAAKDPNKAVIN